MTRRPLITFDEPHMGRAPHPAVQFHRRPSLPAAVRYALVMRPRGPHAGDWPIKPAAFPDLPALARAIHRARGEAGLQLVETELLVRERPAPQRGVSLWTLDPDTGAARRWLGWAWLAGCGRETLQAALDEALAKALRAQADLSAEASAKAEAA